MATPADNMPSIDQWNATWQELGVSCTPALHGKFDDLIARYSEPHRKYHTLRHLDECFAKLEAIHPEADHPAEVEVALWFHDAVYDTRSNRNEARSAELATATILGAGGPAECASRVEALVMATRHAVMPATPDAKVMVDVDLSILGESSWRFDEYERQVREEYAWVPGFVYARERRKILEAFLARPAIFNTLLFRERYEARARANLERSLRA